MTVDVTMPQMGADMTEGTVVKWFKQVGDEVKKGESIAEIETDKANVELEAFDSGVLLKVIANEGDVIPVGQVIAVLGEAGETVAETPAAEPQRPRSRPASQAAARPSLGDTGASQAESTAAPAPAAPAPDRPAPGSTAIAAERIRISPVARRIAADNNVDVSSLQGSGPDGRILRRDVEAAIAAPAPTPPTPQAAPAPPAHTAAARPAAGSRVEPLTRIRQTIARRMLQSKQQAPHYYLALDVDMTPGQEFRRAINATAPESSRITVNDLIIKACALALERHPRFTAVFTEEGLSYPEKLDINIGVALDEGLIAPAVLDCGNKTLGRIAQDARALIARTREGKLLAEDYVTGCFTITNLGNYGVETLIGVINPPQAAILGVGSAMPAAVVKDGAVVVREVMKLALSADHRVSNGAEGALFIKEIQALLENPVSLAL